MKYILRDYQTDASNAAVAAFNAPKRTNGILVLPTGAGKSLVIADIASRIDSPLLVFQPSKEILEQNFGKLQSYGILDCGVYSASVGRKDINRITFATIGSVMNHKKDFDHFKYVLIDECHLVNSKAGMYSEFFEGSERRVVGLTATPYRLSSFMGSSMLMFLTRTRPRIFDKVLYYCQVGELLSKGYLAHLNYYTPKLEFDSSNIRGNSTGADYDEKSLKAEYERSGFYNSLVDIVKRLLHPKRGGQRNGILVFTRFIKEAQMLAYALDDCAVVTGDTPKAERENILRRFKAGEIKVVANAGVLTTGFDYPELDTIVMARPTKSLALWYQIVGRAIRPYQGKIGWIVDLCGNYQRFGRVEDLRVELEAPNTSRWCIKSNGVQLTNVTFY